MNTILNDTEYLSSILSAMSDMVRVISREGKVILANEAFRKRFGVAERHKCYEPFQQDEPCEHCLSREVLEEGGPKRLTRKVGGRVYSVTVSPLKDKNDVNIAAVEDVYKRQIIS